jgi:hypothetical protein
MGRSPAASRKDKGTTSTNVRLWEFPILLKRQMTRRAPELFLIGGPSRRHTRAIAHTVATWYGGGVSRPEPPIDHTGNSYYFREKWTTGAVVGIGTNLNGVIFDLSQKSDTRTGITLP